MQVIRTTVGELSPEDKRKCRSLCYRDNGQLQKWLLYPHVEVVMLKDGERLIGWGARRSNGHSGYYVRKTERRKGYGSFIYHTLNEKKPAPTVQPWDWVAASFFYSVGVVDKEELNSHGVKTAKRKPRSQAIGKVLDKIDR